MRVYRSIDDFTPPVEGITIFIGKADALHLGHIAAINEMIKLAAELGTKSAILSLIPDASNLIFDSESFKFILTEEERQIHLSNWPIDFLIYQRMTSDFTSVTPQEFVSQILIDRLKSRGIVVGWDFRFGAGRSGDVELLLKLSSEIGIRLKIIEPIKVNDNLVKTSLIKELIYDGKIREAWRLLGYPFYVSGVVIKDRGVGHEIGFPTANIKAPPEKVLPRRGVYIGRALFDDDIRWGLINVGSRPTLSDEPDINIEIWLKDFDEDLYGLKIKIEFFQFIRDEIKFNNINELREQIHKDKEELEKFLGNII